MKKLIYFVFLLVVVLALTPWITGFYFKREFFNLVNIANQNNRIKISVVNYEHGWLSSTTKIHIAENLKQQPIELSFDEHITHGPVIYDQAKHTFVIAMAMIETNLHLPAAIEAKLFNNTAASSAVHLNTLVTFDGQWKNQIATPPISLKMPDQSLSWEGLTGNYDVFIHQNRVNSIHSQISVGAISANKSSPTNMDLNISPFSLSYDGIRHTLGVWIGAFKFSMMNFKFNNGNGNQIQINDLIINTKNSLSADKLYDVTQQLSIHKLEMPMSPITLISPIIISLGASHFNIDGVIALSQFVNKMQSTDSSNADFKAQFISLVGKIITPTTSLQSDVSLSTPLGNLIINGHASNFTVGANTIEDITKNTQATMKIRVAMPLAYKLAELYFKMQAPSSNNPLTSPNVTPINQPTEQMSMDAFNDHIADLMKQGKLSLTNSIEIMTLSNQNLTLEQFTDKITALKLSPETISTLTETYAKLLNKQQAKQAATLPSDISNPQDLIANWIKQGYITQNNNDFETSITRDAGVVKINGNALPN